MYKLVEYDPCGLPFRVVMGKSARNAPLPGFSLTGRVEIIIDGLFSVHERREDSTIAYNLNNPQKRMHDKLREAAEKLKNNKAPRPDGITNEKLIGWTKKDQIYS